MALNARAGGWRRSCRNRTVVVPTSPLGARIRGIQSKAGSGGAGLRSGQLEKRPEPYSAFLETIPTRLAEFVPQAAE